MQSHPSGAADCPAVLKLPAGPGASHLLCTRDEGHDGSHIADGLDSVVAIWDSQLAWERDGDLWWRRVGREWVEVR